MFLLTLLRAISPESVDASQMLAGSTARERRLNAKYTISSAHKIGCRVFLNWEDIVEARAKMSDSLLAAAMTVDVKRKIELSANLQNTFTLHHLQRLYAKLRPKNYHA